MLFLIDTSCLKRAKYSLPFQLLTCGILLFDLLIGEVFQGKIVRKSVNFNNLKCDKYSNFTREALIFKL